LEDRLYSGISSFSCLRASTIVRAFLLFFISFAALFAQDRLVGPLDFSRKVVLQGQNHFRFEQYDQGPAESSFQIRYATLILKPTAAQQADLDALLADQQDRSSAG
jgi:hypothetical protein